MFLHKTNIKIYSKLPVKERVKINGSANVLGEYYNFHKQNKDRSTQHVIVYHLSSINLFADHED